MAAAKNLNPAMHPDTILTLIAPTPKRYCRQIVWETVCACGKIKDVPQGNLKYVRSCGCLRREAMRRTGRNNRKGNCQ